MALGVPNGSAKICRQSDTRYTHHALQFAFLNGAFVSTLDSQPNEFLPVTKIPRSGLPEYALVCGDPRRAARIAKLFEHSREIGNNREYVTYRGTWKGIDLTVSSHGVGGSGAVCMFEELAMAGSKTKRYIWGNAHCYWKPEHLAPTPRQNIQSAWQNF